MTEERARELLERERRRIERGLAAAREREGEDEGELSHLDQHPADSATELYDRELDEGIVERLQEELDAIERAYERLEEGTYGLSVESGKPIPDARLEAIPWAARTAEEQERHEHTV
jgi:DnaK suppressor protein